MEEYYWYDGDFFSSGQLLIGPDSRALRFGDGLFETMRVNDGKIALEERHFARLFNGLELLKFQVPPEFSAQSLQMAIAALCRKNNHRNARVRLTVFRGDGSLFEPVSFFPHCLIQSWPIEQSPKFNSKGLVTGFYMDAQKPMDGFANCKTNNFLPYAMAALDCREKGWDQALLLNTAGRVCDATIANVFMVANGNIYTPPLSEGCIAGVMRAELLAQLPQHGFHIKEQAINLSALLAADEVFLTNAIIGIQWIGECEDTRYGNKLTSSVFDAILKKGR